MSLLNADGSYSEVSGNGVRCLGAWIASQRGVAMPGQQAPIDIETDAGVKRLELLPLVDRLILIDRGRILMDGARDKVLETIAAGKIEVPR